MVPVTPLITGIAFVFTFYIRCMSTLKFLITFLSPETATSINVNVTLSLSGILMSGLLLGLDLSVCPCWFHSMNALLSWIVSTNFGTCWYQCLLSYFIHISLHMLKHKVNLNCITRFSSNRTVNTLRLCYKTSQLMLYIKIIAVCIEIHAEHMNNSLHFIRTCNLPAISERARL